MAVSTPRHMYNWAWFNYIANMITIYGKKLAIYGILGWTFAPIMYYIEKYIFSDWEFLKFLIVMTAADTGLGLMKSVKMKNVSSRGFSMIFTKIIVYTGALICTHALVRLTVGSKAILIFSWFDMVIYTGIAIREAISIFENIAIIQPTAFPKYILRYLKDFDNLTGEILLKKQKKESDLEKVE